MLYLSVAVPRPLDRTFDYEYDSESMGEISPGDWVVVPFGRSKLVACVLEVLSEKPVLPEGVQLKAILHRIDPEFSLPGDLIQVCRFGSEYYQYPMGEAFFSAMPPSPEKILGTRKSKPISHELREIQLNDEQQSALETVLSNRKGSTFLLEGITGSGKTEVYIEVAKKVLSEGKSALILVPEIALTAQLKQRFESALGIEVTLWHSALAEGLRQVQWRKIRAGELRVVIGARSAVFAPLQSLGLIVVDEEHDPTYKQEERFRYHGRDLALYRGHLHKIPVILGSATPSLETLHRVREGKTLHLKLSKRFKGQALPEIKLISLSEEQQIIHENVKTPMAERTIEIIREVLDRGEQVIVFLNRRGFSQFLLCQDCGWIGNCPQCSISLTHYQRKAELRCHVCGHQEPVPNECKSCGSYGLRGMGFGTESLEEELKILLPQARIVRLDRDQITSQKRLEETLEEFRSGKANVLLGTQMLVKGHDFEKVTCVLVVSSDAQLKWPDFRSSERAFQTLTQVSGRAGRGTLPGQVLIQGFDLDHPVIQVVRGDKSRDSFLEEELALRRELDYPPFSRLVRFRFQDRNESELRKKVDRMTEHLLKESENERSRFLGPSESLLFKAQDLYRFDFYFKAPTIQALTLVSKKLKRMAEIEEIELVVDVDPYHS